MSDIYSFQRENMKQKIISALVLLVAQLLVFHSAQAFPDRPVKLVVGSPAGGPPDIMARLLSDKMGAALGQPVIVENRPGGAGGTIGARSVIAAEPDGHTLMMGSTSTILIAPLLLTWHCNSFTGLESWRQHGSRSIDDRGGASSVGNYDGATELVSA